VIFIDSNIPMYLIGASHPHKADAQRLLEQALTDRTRLVTDAEVFQEILRRYTAIQRHDAIDPAFRVLTRIVDEVYSIDRATVEDARSILERHPRVSARDTLHVASMQRNGVSRILSFDADFDRIAGITRLR